MKNGKAENEKQLYIWMNQIPASFYLFLILLDN